MKKLKILGLLIVATFVLCGAGCQWFAEPEVIKEETAPIIEEIKKKATLVIDDGTENPQNFELELEEGIEETTAFDLLKKACEEVGLKLDYSESDFGVMINAIGDKKGGQEDKYWLYYVNDEMPAVAADKQEIEAGDKVEFKFEASSF